MKSINKIIVLSAGILVLASCDDFLDTMPDNRAEINSVEKITSLLVSAYPTNSPMLLTELSSDNALDNGVQFTPYNTEQEDSYLWLDINTSGNDSPKYVWDAHYSSIAAANQALDAIEKMGNPAGLQAQKGEALLCRAYSHFALVNVFCLPYSPQTASSDLGLPYSEKPETEVSVAYTRGTMAEIYEKIEADIVAGLPLINDEIYSVPKYHFNRKAAHAFAARFFLYYHKYDKAIEYANVVLGSNPVQILKNWESIAGLASNYTLRCDAYIAANDASNLLITPATSSWPYVHGPYSIGKRYGNARQIIERESFRAAGLWGTASNLYMARNMWGSDEKMTATKFAGYFEYTDKVAGIGYLHSVPVVFTTTETLLCRAEAKILNKDYVGAMEDLNYWITTNTTNSTGFTQEQVVAFYEAIAYMPLVVTTASDRTVKKQINPVGFTVEEGVQENLIQCLLHLRRVETIHEGLRWYDIKRYGIEIAHNRDGLEPDLLMLDDPRRAIQLPQDVIGAGLEANPRK